MASILDVCNIVTAMVDGFEGEVMKCVGENTQTALIAVTEQLYSGLDGEGHPISPNYDNDPFFNEPGPWQHRSGAYKKWKKDITPPEPSRMLGLPARSENMPNLYITGRFYADITVGMDGDVLHTDVDSSGNGPDIVSKYGEQILQLGPTAIEYFVEETIIPHVWNFFEQCGYGR